MTTGTGADTRTPAGGPPSYWIALLVIAAIAFVWVRAPLLSLPLERDEGEYAYIAQRLMQGDVPYRDAFDQKPPAIFLAYLGAFVLLGESGEAIHLFMYAWTLLTAWALFACVRRLAGPLPAAYATLVFAVASGDPKLTANAANTEIFMLLPMVASVACLLRALLKDAGFRWWLFSGMAAGVACWFKQVAVANAVFLAIVPIFALPYGHRGSGVLRAWSGLLLGALAVSVPVVAAFLAAGAWEPFAEAVFRHNIEYLQTNTWSAGVGLIRHRAGEQAPSLAVVWALAAAGLLLPERYRGRARGILGGWFVASALGVSAGLFFRPHYFLQLLPAQAALAGIALGAATVAVRDRYGAGAGVAAAAAMAALVLGPPAVAGAGLRAAGSPAAVSRRIYGYNPFPESVAIGAYIRRTSEPEDRVFVVGSEPQILFYAQRASASRFIFFYPLTGNYPGVLELQKSVVREVLAARPLYVVWSNIATSLLVDAETEPYILVRTKAMLQTDYRLELVAHPIPGDESFEFLYGDEARRLMRRAGDRAGSAPWIALYRRAEGSPNLR